MSTSFELVPGIKIGRGLPLVIIAGPCVLEAPEICRVIAAHMKKLCAELGLPYIFKASFDKANRTSINSARGPGIEAGLQGIAAVGREFGLPILTDVHTAEQAEAAGKVVDVLQIPAFLCRQTDLLLAAARTGKPVNVKKAQFAAPEDMKQVVAKMNAGGCDRVMLTERGTTFGYHNLVVDMRGLVTMSDLGCPVIFDATHSVQQPGGQGTTSGGRREFVFPLARAAAAVGIQGLFLEVHPEPAKALSDGPNSLPLSDVRTVLEKVKAIHALNN